MRLHAAEVVGFPRSALRSDDIHQGAALSNRPVRKIGDGAEDRRQPRDALAHDVEHCWYILQGTGIIRMEGKDYPIKPGDAVFAPIGMPHTVECTGDKPLKYVVVYAPPGPEKDLRKQTGWAKM